MIGSVHDMQFMHQINFWNDRTQESDFVLLGEPSSIQKRARCQAAQTYHQPQHEEGPDSPAFHVSISAHLCLCMWLLSLHWFRVVYMLAVLCYPGAMGTWATPLPICIWTLRLLLTEMHLQG